MASVASAPEPRIPYTFQAAADGTGYLDAHEREDHPKMQYDVIADPSWPGLRHASRMKSLLLLSRVIGLFSVVPVAITRTAGTWTLTGILIAVAILPLIFLCVWYPRIPKLHVTFDWRKRTLRARPRGGRARDVGPALALDDARFEAAPAPHGHAVWARGPGEAERLVGYFRNADVARAYRDRIERLVRDKRYAPSA